MKILLALNSFKDSCNSIQANKTLKKGLMRHISKKDITVFPLFDGGDGSVDGLKFHLDFRKIITDTINALGQPIQSYYLLDPAENIAYIELAQASGISIIGKENNNVMLANTEGTGHLIRHALGKGVSKIVLLIGGSATNDAGIGALHALGVKFLDKNGKQLPPFPDQMHKINKIDTSDRLDSGIPIEIWSDVTNPFTGIKGAVSVFSPQKGASKKDQIILEKGMINFSRVIQRLYDVDLNKVSGAGAAGGIGAGFYSILGSTITQCTHNIFRMLRVREYIKSHDMIITGEGGLDIQSMYGKLVHGICLEAKKLNKPIIGICGSNKLSPLELKNLGLTSVFSIVQGPCTLEYAIKNWEANMVSIGSRLGALLRLV